MSQEAAADEDLTPQAIGRGLHARILADRGNHREAEELARSAAALFAQTDLLSLRADTLLELSHVLAAAGQVSDAHSAATEALDLYRLKGNLPGARDRSNTLPNPHLPERMLLMPMPYVISATINQENKLVLTVKIDDGFTTGEPLEISGHATQNGGAFAVFNVIKNVPALIPMEQTYIYVTATPSQPFVKGHPVAVVLRAATVWATGLNEPQSAPVIAAKSSDAAEAATPGMSCHVAYAPPRPRGTTVTRRQVLEPAFPTTNRSGRPARRSAGTGLYHGKWWDLHQDDTYDAADGRPLYQTASGGR